MFLGIDVGGTFTDAVVVSDGRIIASAKSPTTHEDLLGGIFRSLDTVLTGLTGTVRRVSLSTTIVTNNLVEGRTEPVGLILIPGPGLDIVPLLPARALVIDGYIDHRGREIAAVDVSSLHRIFSSFSDHDTFAVSGKFAIRNPKLETKISQEILKQPRVCHVTAASAISGSLNFLRRTNSAYFNAAVWKRFNRFATAVEGALAARAITAPVYILKADGGTMPLSVARNQPVEAIFTGPAASVLGIMAAERPQGDTISLDIGGTTTDIALWRGGLPLMAVQGAFVGSYPTAVRSFLLQSVGIGGDSFVRRQDGRIIVGPERKGPPQSFGGLHPTVTDALVVAGRIDCGNLEAAIGAMGKLALPDQSPGAVAAEVLTVAVGTITAAVKSLIERQQSQPVYTVDNMINAASFLPQSVVSVGGAAAGLAPLLAERLGVSCQVPPEAPVANALGAAVACATTEITVRIDTEQEVVTVAELGLQGKLESKRISLPEARAMTAKYLADRAAKAGITFAEAETVYEEEFNLVRGFRTTGKIMTCRQQVKPGVSCYAREG